MRVRLATAVLAGITGAGSLFLVCGAVLTPSSGREPAPRASQPERLTIDYPLDGSLFPPEITPPTFLWHDPSETAKRWVVEVSFANHSNRIRVETPGEFMQVGENDHAQARQLS